MPHSMISNQSKTFFMTVFLVVFVAVIYTYYDTVVLKKFDVFLTVDDIPTYSEIFSEFALIIKEYVQR